MGIYNGITKASKVVLAILIIAAVLSICFFSFEMWAALISLAIVILIVPYIILSVKYPDVVIFISVLLVFTPLERSVSIHFYMVISLAIILFIKNIILHKPVIIFDLRIFLFSTYFILSIASFTKWISVYRGVRGSLPLFILPLLFYIFFNSNYVSRKGAERFFTYYFPLLYTYIIGQLIVIVYQGSAVTGYSFNEFHSGFNLGWGKSVFVAAVLAFFMFLVYRTFKMWKNNKIIRNLVYFDFCISIVVLTLIMARAPVVSFIGSLVLYYIYIKFIQNKKIQFKATNVIYALLVITPLYFIFKAFVMFLIERFIHMKTDASFIVRIYMYSDALNTFLHNIITGAGPDQHFFKQVFTYKETDPNNVFLSYAVSFGIFGLSIIILLFVLPFVKVARTIKKTNSDVVLLGTALLPVFILAIINSSFEVIITSFAYGSLFWILYALFYMMHSCEIDGNTGNIVWS